jgi:hypothetical protein
MRSTTTNIARLKQPTINILPDKVGKYSRRIDIALPGKDSKKLYDQLSRREASVFIQLRTGMARLNKFLYQIQTYFDMAQKSIDAGRKPSK